MGLANRSGDGLLLSGREIARQYGRHGRWGGLVKRSGSAGELAAGREPGQPGLHLVGQRLPLATSDGPRPWQTVKIRLESRAGRSTPNAEY